MKGIMCRKRYSKKEKSIFEDVLDWNEASKSLHSLMENGETGTFMRDYQINSGFLQNLCCWFYFYYQ